MWIAALVSVVEFACIAAIMFMLPRVTRRGLLFGVYIGEALARGERAAAITRSWYRGMVAAILVSLAAGVSLYLSGRARLALFLPDFILLLGMGRCYYVARRTGTLQDGHSRADLRRGPDCHGDARGHVCRAQVRHRIHPQFRESQRSCLLDSLLPACGDPADRVGAGAVGVKNRPAGRRETAQSRGLR